MDKEKAVKEFIRLTCEGFYTKNPIKLTKIQGKLTPIAKQLKKFSDEDKDWWKKITVV